MNRLSYEYRNSNGVVENISTYDEARQAQAQNGGSFKAIYTPIEKEYIYRGKRKRPIAKAPKED